MTLPAISVLDPDHIKRLTERRLDPDLAASLGVHSVQGALALTYRVRGQVHNIKLRRGKGNMPWAQTGRPLVLWNVDCLDQEAHPDEPVIITEGELDALALLQVGFRFVVSVPNGAPKNENESGDSRFTYLYERDSVTLIPGLARAIAMGRKIILATDGDAPGINLRNALSARIGDEHCLWVPWPEGCKDANDVLMREGPETLQVVIWAAKRMWTDRLSVMSEIPDPAPIVPMTTGFEHMDRPLSQGGIRLPRSGFVTIAGPAHQGKSVFVRQLLWHLWRTYGARFALTALEESPKPRYQRDFRRLHIGRGEWTDRSVAAADDEIDRAMVIMRRVPGEPLTLDALLGLVEYAIKAYGCRVICIDPANEIEHEETRDMSAAIGRMIMAMKVIADRFGALIIVVSHPPIEVVRRKRPDSIWGLSDVEGSRHWAGKSDVGFMLWRPGIGADVPTIVHACKLKDNEILGRPNLFEMRMNTESWQFYTTESGYAEVTARILDAVGDVKN